MGIVDKPVILEPYFVDTKTAGHLLSLGKTSIFAELREGGRLTRVKHGRKTLVTMESIRQFAASTARPLLEIGSQEPKPTREVATPKLRSAKAEVITAQAPEPPAPGCREVTPSAPDFDDSWLTLAGVASEQL